MACQRSNSNGSMSSAARKPGALGVLPDPDVAVFHKPNQVRHRFVRVKKLPRQTCTRLLHVKVHHATAAAKTGELFSSAQVVVEHDQLGRPLFDGTQNVVSKRKVQDVHRAPGPVRASRPPTSHRHGPARQIRPCHRNTARRPAQRQNRPGSCGRGKSPGDRGHCGQEKQQIQRQYSFQKVSE